MGGRRVRADVGRAVARHRRARRRGRASAYLRGRSGAVRGVVAGLRVWRRTRRADRSKSRPGRGGGRHVRDHVSPCSIRRTRARNAAVAYGVWGAVSGAAAAIGPVLGGVLTQGLSWNWIFFVNLPVSIVAIVLSLRVLPVDATAGGGTGRLAGTAAFTVAAGGLTYALIRAGVVGWGSWTSWGPMMRRCSRTDRPSSPSRAPVRPRHGRPVAVRRALVRRHSAGRAGAEHFGIRSPDVRLHLAAIGDRAVADPGGPGRTPAGRRRILRLRIHRPAAPRPCTRPDHRWRTSADRNRRGAHCAAAARQFQLAGADGWLCRDRRRSRAGHPDVVVGRDGCRPGQARRDGLGHGEHHAAARIRHRHRSAGQHLRSAGGRQRSRRPGSPAGQELSHALAGGQAAGIVAAGGPRRSPRPPGSWCTALPSPGCTARSGRPGSLACWPGSRCCRWSANRPIRT